MPPQTLALGLLWYVAFLLSLTCHETAHALAAKLGGDPTAAHQGQGSLSPIPHMRREPLGTIVVPILSYLLGGWMIGWGSAPYDPNWQRQYPRRAAWMALAGPLANISLLLIAAAAIHIGIALGEFSVPGRASFTRVAVASGAGLREGLATFLSILFSLNLLLAVFNLLPFPPLDGNSVVGLFLPPRMALRFAELSRHQSLALVGLLLAWTLFDHLFGPVFLAALNLLYPGARYH